MKIYKSLVEDYIGELFFKIPAELIEELGWEVDDKITWIDNNDGSFSLRKNDDN